jgi:hypothetical protein
MHQLRRHARTKGPQPKRLPSNANYDVRRMRRNRPQREQMPDSSVQCMWSSKSQITNEPLCPEHVCTLCNGEELPKGHNHNICPRAECQTCKLFGDVAKDCVYANCLDVNIDWFNLLCTNCQGTLEPKTTETITLECHECKRELPSRYSWILAI